MLDIFFSTLLCVAYSSSVITLQCLGAMKTTYAYKVHGIAAICVSIVGCLCFGPLDYLIGGVASHIIIEVTCRILLAKTNLLDNLAEAYGFPVTS